MDGYRLSPQQVATWSASTTRPVAPTRAAVLSTHDAEHSVAVLQAACRRLEILRTRFITSRSGEPLQVVSPEPEPGCVEVRDLKGGSRIDLLAALGMAPRLGTPSSGPNVRFLIVRAAAGNAIVASASPLCA